MSAEAVRTNYNSAGIEIIESMYAQNYLSIGGVHSTDVLARSAGVTASSRVLDVGSGIGGPALHLAEIYGCLVTGLDLIELNVEESTSRAKVRRLDHLVDFHVGDATHMPFAAATFDIVWGQDAWCHVTDKNAMMGECARVLESGGIIAFTDWLVTRKMDDADRREVLAAAASTSMATAWDYRQLLERHGFTACDETDISDIFVRQYQDIMAGLARLEGQITDKFGAKVYQIVAEKNATILQAFENGSLGGGRFIARKPPE
jgi:ubiquinone/menaquinone biosynthesis C-methylase UbiE